MIDERLRLRTEMPHFRAMCRDGSAWPLTLNGLDGFRRAWMAGRAFWTGVTIWGEPIDVKLADITGITVWTEDTIELMAEEAAEIKRRELTS